MARKKDSFNTTKQARDLTAKAGETRSTYRDEGLRGHFLRVTPKGVRTYWVAARNPSTGKTEWVKVGDADVMDLEDARKKARPELDRIKAGIDRAPATEPSTFEAALDDYHRRYLIGEAGNASAGDVRSTLLREAAAWKSRALPSILPRDVGALVEGIRDSGRPYLANRTFAYLRTFFDWCARPNVGYVKASPCEGLRRPFDGEETRDREFSPDEIASLWHAAGRLGTYEGAYLRVLLLTGKRKSALAAMKHDEIDNRGWWNPPQPKTRRKPKKTNLPIPLPRAALRIVRALPKVENNDHMFVGRRAGIHLDPGTALQKRIQEASGVSDFFWHAVRHTVATKLSELRVPDNAARRFTDHAPPKDAHQGYVHDSLEDVTHDAADTWGRYVTLVARRRVWAKVADHLDAQDIKEEDRREIQRERRREFCAMIQAGGKQWGRWVGAIARPASRHGNVIPLRAEG